MKYIDIPIDTSIHFDKILKRLHDQDWRRLNRLEEIEKYLNKRNSVHLHQAQGTTRTIEPLKMLLGKDSFTKFGTNYYKVLLISTT